MPNRDHNEFLVDVTASAAAGLVVYQFGSGTTQSNDSMVKGSSEDERTPYKEPRYRLFAWLKRFLVSVGTSGEAELYAQRIGDLPRSNREIEEGTVDVSGPGASAFSASSLR